MAEVELGKILTHTFAFVGRNRVYQALNFREGLGVKGSGDLLYSVEGSYWDATVLGIVKR